MWYSDTEVDDCAERLYALAAAVVRAAVVSGVIGGVIVGCLIGTAFARSPAGLSLGALIGAAIGGYLGYEIGRTRSLHLRLEAQNALCLGEIYDTVCSLRDAVAPSAQGDVHGSIDGTRETPTSPALRDDKLAIAAQSAEVMQTRIMDMREQEGRCVNCGKPLGNDQRAHSRCKDFVLTTEDAESYVRSLPPDRADYSAL